MKMTQQNEPITLRKGDLLPLFEVATVEGTRVRYADLWQRKNVVIVTLPTRLTETATNYARELSRRSADFDVHCAGCIVTTDAIAGLPCTSVVIADRWGEVHYASTAADVTGLPTPEEVLDTLDYIQRKCPECEGEYR